MKRLYVGILILFGIIVVLQLAIPPIRILVYKDRNPHTTAYMEVMRKDMIKKTGTDSLFRHQFVPIHKISPSLVHAVNCAEDRGRFFYHHGLVASHIIYAIRKHESGYPLHGGSCITQQTAKNIFLTHRRSYVRKIKELYYAILMEKIWGKERIMECYLNYVEFGYGIFGCEEASQYYFGHSASSLSDSESISLAILLPYPRVQSPPHFISQELGSYWRIKNNMICYPRIPFPVPDQLPDGQLKNEKYGVGHLAKWCALHFCNKYLNISSWHKRKNNKKRRNVC